jgi:hypothetical protein
MKAYAAETRVKIKVAKKKPSTKKRALNMKDLAAETKMEAHFVKKGLSTRSRAFSFFALSPLCYSRGSPCGLGTAARLRLQAALVTAGSGPAGRKRRARM